MRLKQAQRQYGLPTTIRVERGSPFTSKRGSTYGRYAKRIMLDLSRQGSCRKRAVERAVEDRVNSSFARRRFSTTPRCCPQVTGISPWCVEIA